MNESKFFEVDYTKKKFSITIDVYENGQAISMTNHIEKDVTYEQMVGTLEIAKINFVQKQSEQNRKSKTAPKKKK